MSTGTPRKPPVFGPEPWKELGGRSWSYWDLWFAAVAVVDHAESLDNLEDYFLGEMRSHIGGRRDAESKLSHLDDLRSRFEEAGLGPADLATSEMLADTRVLVKARKKVSERWVEGRAMTPAMVETPRMRLVRRSRYGHWNTFPVDPGLYYRSFRRHVEVRDVISKYKSFAAVDRVHERLCKLDQPSLSVAQRLALYRAFHTAGLELADRSDDSHGNISELRVDAWQTYLGIDWSAAEIRSEDYWADLCDLVVFEPYALDYEDETRPWRNIPGDHIEVVEGCLASLAAECASHHLDYQADEARQQLAWLAVASQRISRYVEVATRLGSEHWIPVVAMADSALRTGRRELALDVFLAADRPGIYQSHLRRRCQMLTGVDISDEQMVPTLRRVIERPGGGNS